MPDWLERVGTVLGARDPASDGPRAVADVPVSRWHDAVRACRDDLGCDFFDWLSAVDDTATETEAAADEDAEDAEPGTVGMRIIAHLWSVAGRRGVLLRTVADGPVPTVTDLYAGASWHERETHEMFGVDFAGHPGLAPLLLPEEFEGHPLRKDFVLASRVVKPWPGAKEPGGGSSQSMARKHRQGEGARKRAPKRPPGVPEGWMEEPGA